MYFVGAKHNKVFPREKETERGGERRGAVDSVGKAIGHEDLQEGAGGQEERVEEKRGPAGE